MRSTHSFIYRTNKYEFQDEEDYKNKYRIEEDEINKEKQKIATELTKSMNKLKKLGNEPEEENYFLSLDDKKSKKKENPNSPVFIPQSQIDFESEKVRYPKYSPTIYPYVSPIKEKSPSKRFQERFSSIHFSPTGNTYDD